MEDINHGFPNSIIALKAIVDSEASFMPEIDRVTFRGWVVSIPGIVQLPPWAAVLFGYEVGRMESFIFGPGEPLSSDYRSEEIVAHYKTLSDAAERLFNEATKMRKLLDD